MELEAEKLEQGGNGKLEKNRWEPVERNFGTELWNELWNGTLQRRVGTGRWKKAIGTDRWNAPLEDGAEDFCSGDMEQKVGMKPR